MPPSKEDLISIVQKHYDSTNAFMFTTGLTPEAKRLDSAWKKWIQNRAPWHAFRYELSRALPSHIIGETYPSMDGGPRCIVYQPRASWTARSNWDVVGCVSLLAPVYFVYGVQWDYIDGVRQNFSANFGQPPPIMAEPVQVMTKSIEKTFGFEVIPPELANTPVALYAGLLEPHETTLFHTLFTNESHNIP
ncbi:hypothetical protein [Archangium primigenium]|uniref:hypothetical protein n=1 Tax=[Archangium] primigenium TaxID=2792470 RepID=UPI00195A8137|nr:hypothetical protein [Archangium primigenium]MBM7118371.1 hypothetical protein [Archangium primigenium]